MGLKASKGLSTRSACFGVALDHRPLEFNGAVHCVDDIAEFDDDAVAGALDDAAVMHRDGRVDQVAAKGPKASEGWYNKGPTSEFFSRAQGCFDRALGLDPPTSTL